MTKRKHQNQPAGRTAGDGKPGYKNIDPKHRWVKGGPSPNPLGRRRKPPPSLSEQLHQDLVDLLKSTVPTPNGERLTVHQALLRRVVAEGLNDARLALKAYPLLLAVVQGLEPKATDVSSSVIKTEDADLIRETLERLSKMGGRGRD